MATIAVAVTKTEFKGEKVDLILWETLVSGSEDGAPYDLNGREVLAVQAVGTFSSATLVIQGSLDGGSTYATLREKDGSALSTSAVNLFTVGERPLTIRPFISGEDGSDDIDVYMLVKREY